MDGECSGICHDYFAGEVGIRLVFAKRRISDMAVLMRAEGALMAKELSELNINLGDSGVEIIANYRNI